MDQEPESFDHLSPPSPPHILAQWTRERRAHGHHHTPDYPFTPQLGWTSTRSETFRSCRRRYFFQYYARYDRELQLVRIQRLKSLSSIPTAGSQAVHDVVAGLLSLT